MAGEVSFDEEQSVYAAPSSGGGMLTLVKKWGLAKDDAGAQKVLLGTAIAAIILAVGIAFMFLIPHTPPKAPYIPPPVIPGQGR